MAYKKLPASALATGVTRIDDGAFIPADPRNIDWQAYQAWLQAGNTPAEAEQAKAPTPANKAPASIK